MISKMMQVYMTNDEIVPATTYPQNTMDKKSWARMSRCGRTMTPGEQHQSNKDEHMMSSENVLCINSHIDNTRGEKFAV